MTVSPDRCRGVNYRPWIQITGFGSAGWLSLAIAIKYLLLGMINLLCMLQMTISRTFKFYNR